MSNSDSQVEVKIVGTLDGSVQASAQGAKAQMAALSTESQNLGRTLQQEAAAWQQQSQAASTAAGVMEETTEKVAQSHGAVSTATREFRALFDELSSGRTRQTPGTLAIIAQRVLGLSGSALLAVAGVAALTAGLGYLVVRALDAASALNQAKLAADFSGNSGISTQQLQTAINMLDQFANVSNKDAEAVITSFARMRDMSGPELQALAELVGEYAETQGVKAPEAAKIFIAALENEKLSAAELVKIIPGITQAQIENIEATQRMGNAHQTAATLLSIMDDALQRTRNDFVQQEAGMFSSFKTFGAYLGLLESGESLQQIHTELVKQNTDAWNKNQQAILADLDALRKTASAPPPQDLIEPIQKTEDAIAHLDATWKGSTSARYAAEAGLWNQLLQGTNLNAQQREDAQRRADEALFHSHEAATTAMKRLDKEQNEEALRAIEEEALGAQKGSSEQIAAYQKLYDTAVRLDGARSQQALSAERELSAARSAAAQEMLTQIAAVETAAISKDNEAASDKLQNIRTEFQERAITASQEIDLSREVEAQRYSLTQNSLNSLLQIWKGYPDKLDEVNKEIEANERTHQKNMDAIARDGARDMTQEYERAWQPVLSGFDTMVDGIMSGNETLMQVLERGAVTIAEDYIREQIRQMSQTLLTEQAKTAAVEAGNAARTTSDAAASAAQQGSSLKNFGPQIMNDAKVAAANTYATISAIPVVGPFLAPPAAAAAFAAVAAFDSLASFDVGTNQVPSDMLAMVHQGERIIPAADNSALMSALDGVSSTSSSSEGDSGGASGTTLVIQNLTVSTPPGASPAVQGRLVAQAIAREVRNGNANIKQAMQPA